MRRYEAYKRTGKKPKQSGPDPATIIGGTVKTEWDFDETIRGTIKGMPVNLDLDALDEVSFRSVPSLNLQAPSATSTMRTASTIKPARGPVLPQQELSEVANWASAQDVSETRETRSPRSGELRAGSLVDQVILPSLDSVSLPILDVRPGAYCKVAGRPGTHESLSAIRAGFADLGMNNPALAREIVDAVVERLGGWCVMSIYATADLKDATSHSDGGTAQRPLGSRHGPQPSCRTALSAM